MSSFGSPMAGGSRREEREAESVRSAPLSFDAESVAADITERVHQLAADVRRPPGHWFRFACVWVGWLTRSVVLCVCSEVVLRARRGPRRSRWLRRTNTAAWRPCSPTSSPPSRARERSVGVRCRPGYTTRTKRAMVASMPPTAASRRALRLRRRALWCVTNGSARSRLAYHSLTLCILLSCCDLQPRGGVVLSGSAPLSQQLADIFSLGSPKASSSARSPTSRAGSQQGSWNAWADIETNVSLPSPSKLISPRRAPSPRRVLSPRASQGALVSKGSARSLAELDDDMCVVPRARDRGQARPWTDDVRCVCVDVCGLLAHCDGTDFRRCLVQSPAVAAVSGNCE